MKRCNVTSSELETWTILRAALCANHCPSRDRLPQYSRATTRSKSSHISLLLERNKPRFFYRTVTLVVLCFIMYAMFTFFFSICPYLTENTVIMNLCRNHDNPGLRSLVTTETTVWLSLTLSVSYNALILLHNFAFNVYNSLQEFKHKHFTE